RHQAERTGRFELLAEAFLHAPARARGIARVYEQEVELCPAQARERAELAEAERCPDELDQAKLAIQHLRVDVALWVDGSLSPTPPEARSRQAAVRHVADVPDRLTGQLGDRAREDHRAARNHQC